MKITQNKGKKENTKGSAGKSTELKTDYPLSEKDEVKQAETRLRKAVKKRS